MKEDMKTVTQRPSTILPAAKPAPVRRLSWDVIQGGAGAIKGKAGEWHVFTLTRTSSEADRPFKVKVHLTGMREVTLGCYTDAEAKVYAEAVWANWIQRAGV